MLQTFEAVLKGNILEWANEAPKESDRPLKVYVTLLEEDSSLSADIRRQKVVEILQKIAATNAFASVSDPVEWQRELRQDRPLASRTDEENDDWGCYYCSNSFGVRSDFGDISYDAQDFFETA